jgi:hypothetical protein
MVERNDQTLHRQLRERIGKFLSNNVSSSYLPLLSTVQRIVRHKWEAFLFGGTLRDLMVFGASKQPRDVDIVIAGATTDELADVFGDLLCKRTRFGGLHLQSRGWMFDIWPLSDTWAFHQPEYAGSNTDFANLPRTTFLNVEAIAVELATTRGKTRRVYEHGFFEALREQKLEINFEENPFPSLCVVRTLVTAARLQFSIGPKLAKYLVHYGKIFSAEELVEVQVNHYGWCRRTASQFDLWLRAIEDQYESGVSTSSGVRLPSASSHQSDLFKDWTPAW